MASSVYDFLSGSRVASVAARLSLGEGCEVAIWDNTRDHVRYDGPVGNTFSLYLAGGAGTRRLDAGGIAGHSGAVCVMPEGCDSEWEITEPFRFVHLYLSGVRLRSGFAATHDCDARRLDLGEKTFADAPTVADPLRALSVAAATGDALLGEAALAGLFAALGPAPVALRGGLAPRTLRQVDDWIESHLDGTIALADLAALAGLSEYHFHRMFRQSRGVAPHAWVMRRRIDRARRMLLAGHGIAETAAACGFSSQSHLTRSFRRHCGQTPAQYRMAARTAGSRRLGNRA